MLLLIVPYRNVGGAVDENVSRHQARIGEQTEGRVLTVLAGLVLELRHAVHPADARDAVEYPCEFCVLQHLTLVEDDVLLRVDAARQEGGGDRTRLVGQIVMRHGRGQRVQIDDTIDALMAVLQRDKLLQRAQIIAEVKIARRLNAGEDELPEFAHGSFLNAF